MTNSVSARGYTRVVLVMNIRRFINIEDQDMFEGVRGTGAFLQALRDEWPERVSRAGAFVPAAHDGNLNDAGRRIPTDQVGFMTGVFRQNALDEYVTPTYYLADKSKILFPKEVADNLQFQRLFLEIWKTWDIFLRPTATGMFVVRLQRKYNDATPIMRVASQLVQLQSPFDIPSAYELLKKLSLEPDQDQPAVQEKKKTIEALLNWLEVDPKKDQPFQWQPQYAPVQWKLAMEVCRKFIEDTGMTLALNGHTLRFHKPDYIGKLPLHDSYVIYHFDQIIAEEDIINRIRIRADEHDHDAENNSADAHDPPPPPKARAATKKNKPKILVYPGEIIRSREIRACLIGLIEGSILNPASARSRDTNGVMRTGKMQRIGTSKLYFPEHQEDYMHDVFECNTATWHDELCILTPRSAIVIPSHRAQKDELVISNFAASTGRVLYTWYWEAIERMFEFVVEIRVLAQLMERNSVRLLQDFETEITQIRSGMFKRDIRVNYERLSVMLDKVANLSRMFSVIQRLSTPSVWSRTEFVIEKANSLLQQQDVPLLIQHTERNLSHLNGLINHVDELYLADLSESNNKIAFLLSIFFAGLSLSIVLFAIVSFWADAKQIQPDLTIDPTITAMLPTIINFGNILAIALVLVALGVMGGSLVWLVIVARKGRRYARHQKNMRRLVAHDSYDRPAPKAHSAAPAPQPGPKRR